MDHGRLPLETEMVLCSRMIRPDIVRLSCLVIQKLIYVYMLLDVIRSIIQLLSLSLFDL